MDLLVAILFQQLIDDTLYLVRIKQLVNELHGHQLLLLSQRYAAVGIGIQ